MAYGNGGGSCKGGGDSMSGLIGMPASKANGVTAYDRFDNLGALITGAGKAPYAELVQQGLVYGGCQPAGTGVAPGTAIGTTAAGALGNIAGTGVLLSILGVSIGYISGTLGAGVIQILKHAATIPITAISGTAIVAQNMRTDLANSAKGTLFYTATVPASGLAIWNVCSLGASLATTAVAPWQIWEEIGGAIAVGAGTGVSLQATAAAGSTPLITFGMYWAEYPEYTPQVAG